MPTKTLQSQQKSKSTIETIIFISLCILLFYPPFFRGLYFERELLPTQILFFALTIVWLISKFKDKQYKLIKTPVDTLAIGVVFMYFISISYAVNVRLAIGEALKYANYFLIFLLVRDLLVTETRQKIILNIILLGGVIVSIIGIGTAIGTWSYNGAFVSGRINSTFQYPNTLASYLGALYLITLGFILVESNKILKAVYGVISSTLLFTFILTYSRGMWLILPVMLLLFIIFIPNRRKLEAILYMFISFAVNIPLSFLFSSKLNQSHQITWIIFIAAAILTGVLIYLASYLEDRLQKISLKKLLVIVSILAIIAVAVIWVLFNQTTELALTNTGDSNKLTIVWRNVEGVESNKEYELVVKYEAINEENKPYSGRVRIYSVDTEGELAQLQFTNITDINKHELSIPFTTAIDTHSIRVYFDNYYTNTSIIYKEAKIIDKEKNIIENIPLKYKYIPENIINRLESISLKEDSAEGRLTFYNDAFKIIKDYFILGIGGGGWRSLYKAYQSYSYTSRQAHNFFMQMWIEIGTVGFVLFIAFICLLTYYSYKKYIKSNINKRIFITSIYISVLSILVHAVMDFDLSLSALTYILWMLFGILAIGVENTKVESMKINNTKVLKITTSTILVVAIIFSSRFMVGNIYAQKALVTRNKDINKTIEYFEKASYFDPYKAEYKTDLSSFYKILFDITKKKDYLIKAKELTDSSLKLAPYNPQIKAVGSALYMKIGYIDKALELINETVKLQPMETVSYVQKCDAYLTAFYYYASQKKDLNKAKEIIKEAYKVKEEINHINKITLQPLKYNEDLLYKIGFIQFNYENLFNKEYNIPKGYTLDFAYYFDLDINGDRQIDMLRTWNSQRGNTGYKNLEEKNTNFIRITNGGESYGIVYPYGLKLEPNTDYKIYFKARGNVKGNTFRFFVYDNNASKKNQGELKNIKLNEDWQIFSLEITTDEDIKPGTQYLGFQHNGNDNKYIDLEEVVVFRKVK